MEGHRATSSARTRAETTTEEAVAVHKIKGASIVESQVTGPRNALILEAIETLLEEEMEEVVPEREMLQAAGTARVAL